MYHDLKLEKLINDIISYKEAPPAVRIAACLDAAALVIHHHITDPAEHSEAKKAYRKRALNNVCRYPKGGDISLHSGLTINPKTQELIYLLEETCQAFMKKHRCKTNFPVYDAAAGLMFETLLARDIDTTWQDGLRGLLISLYPPSEPRKSATPPVAPD